MTRRVARLTIAMFAVVLAVCVAPQIAAAQDDEYTPSIDDRSSDFGNSFVAPDIQPSSDPADTTTTGGTGGGDSTLAVTGSEVEPIAAISIGLLAIGGSAMVSSRRRLRDLFSR